MYKKIIRPLFFIISPETIHEWVVQLINVFGGHSFFSFFIKKAYSFENPSLQKNIMGIQFSNQIGLAAGFDKNAKMIHALPKFGFGFIEIGTVTPKPQAGNPKPRMFRLREDEALINRMGFNNDGVEAIAKRLEAKKTKAIIGGNIGKNKDTPNEKAVDDYKICFERLFNCVDYFVVNVSSPNTPDLRALQDKEPLKNILNELQKLNNVKSKSKPILLKIAPDLNQEQLNDIIEIVKETRINGVIATNTTISRENLKTSKEIIQSIGNGGLSGKPVRQKSTEIISYLRKHLDVSFVIIGVGGIYTVDDAKEKINAGADLIQVYTGYIYEGPGMIKRILKSMVK